MTSVLQANPISSVIEDEAQSWRKRLDKMQAGWVSLFTPREPKPFPYDPIFQDKMQVASMIEYFDKKQEASSSVGEYIKLGFTSDGGWLDKPTLELAMAEHFTQFLAQFEKAEDGKVIVNGKPRHKLNVILAELANEDVREPLTTRAYEADRTPTVSSFEQKIDDIATRVSTMTSSIALRVSDATTTTVKNINEAAVNFSIQGPARDQLDILKYGAVIPMVDNIVDKTEQPAPKKSWLASTASSIAMGFNKHVKPAITNLNEAVENFSFKDSVQSVKEDLVNTAKSLKKAYDHNATDLFMGLGASVATTMGLKIAFNAAAAATGVGLVAAPVYGVVRTYQEEWSKSKAQGNDWIQALKDAQKTKVNMNFLKRTAKHSLFFGVGFGFGVGFDSGASNLAAVDNTGAELSSKVGEVNVTSEPVASQTDVQKLVLLSELPAEELEAMQVVAEPVVETIEEPVIELTAIQQKLAGLEGMTPEVLESLKDASPQDIKDTAVTQLWSKDGDQSLGALLMEKAAEMGNRQAMNDVVALRDMGILSEAPSVEAQVAEIKIPESISERMASENPRVVMQAKNDMAVALLNGPDFADLGVEKNFPLGVAALDELASAGHEKSIRDLDTLVDYGMVSKDTLSTETQMNLVLNDGALAACSRSLDTCSFSESAINDAVVQSTDSKITSSSLKEAISKGFNMLQSGVNDIVPFNKAPEAGLVAAIK